MSENCLVDGTSQSSLPVAALALPGLGFYYLVRGANVCGVGSYGLSAAAALRESAACP